jgi:hypothetical protein
LPDTTPSVERKHLYDLMTQVLALGDSVTAARVQGHLEGLLDVLQARRTA